jgi:hypothetical protein
MSTKPKLLLCLAFAAVLAGCGEPKLDYSSPEAAQASTAKIMESLSPEEREAFVQAQSFIISSTVFNTPLSAIVSNPTAAIDAANERLHGKTAYEVIALAEEIKNGGQKNQDNNTSPATPVAGLPPPPPSLQFDTPLPPTSAFFVGGKTPATSLITGNLPDVAGIRIGEPLNPSLIVKLNPAYEINKYRDRDRRESGISASTGHDKLEVMWNEAGIVWHVGRKIWLEEGERFMIDALKASLMEKYGQPSQTTRGGFLWAYDREGNFYSGSDASSLCEWDYGSYTAPRSFKPNCGYKIEVDISTDRRIEGAVTSYSVATTYTKPIFDELIFKDKEEKLAKQRKFEEDTLRAQQNRPQL